MQNLNDQFDEYRDCLRVVWNLALRHRLKGTVAFPDVSQALLAALVLDDLREATPLNTKRTADHGIPGLGSVTGYIPALGVVFCVLRLLYCRRSSAETRSRGLPQRLEARVWVSGYTTLMFLTFEMPIKRSTSNMWRRSLQQTSAALSGAASSY
jgi:hypothetical protein